MLISDRFLVVLVDLWSRWKFLVPAVLLLFIVLTAISSLSLILFTFGMLASFFCFHMGSRDNGKQILLTVSQAKFLMDAGTVKFNNRLSRTPPSTLHELWEVLKEQEKQEREDLAASRRSDLVRIFNSDWKPFDYDAAKAEAEQDDAEPRS